MVYNDNAFKKLFENYFNKALVIKILLCRQISSCAYPADTESVFMIYWKCSKIYSQCLKKLYENQLSTSKMIHITVLFAENLAAVNLYCVKCNTVRKKEDCIMNAYIPQRCIKCNERIKFHCLKCSKMYTSHTGMWTHLKHSHGKPVQYKCSLCNYKSTYKGNLTRHVKGHKTIWSILICKWLKVWKKKWRRW